MEEHNRGKDAFTKQGIPWRMVYSQVFESRAESMSMEKAIKKRGLAGSWKMQAGQLASVSRLKLDVRTVQSGSPRRAKNMKGCFFDLK